MYYTTNQVLNASTDFENCLDIPSMMTDFVNIGASVENTKGGKDAHYFQLKSDCIYLKYPYGVSRINYGNLTCI